MKIKTSELQGKALDYAVALAEGGGGLWFDTVATWWVKIDGKDRALSNGWSKSQSFCPSTDWAQGGTIIEREDISVFRRNDNWLTDSQGFCTGETAPVWGAVYGPHHDVGACGKVYEIVADVAQLASTPLIAAMRCYVAGKLGNEVEVPDNLLK
jgi:hypothetical protein